MEDKRPKWDYDITIDRFEKLCRHITKVTHHWEMTGADTSKDWVVLHFEGGSMKVANMREIRDWVEFKPYHAGLFELTWKGKEARKQIDKIRKWEKSHAAEISEFERLKKKFG